MSDGILNFEASKKAMDKFNDDEKALLMMDMVQNLFEAHKNRREEEDKNKKLQEENKILREKYEDRGLYIEELKDQIESLKLAIGRTSELN